MFVLATPCRSAWSAQCLPPPCGSPTVLAVSACVLCALLQFRLFGVGLKSRCIPNICKAFPFSLPYAPQFLILIPYAGPRNSRSAGPQFPIARHAIPGSFLTVGMHLLFSPTPKRRNCSKAHRTQAEAARTAGEPQGGGRHWADHAERHGVAKTNKRDAY